MLFPLPHLLCIRQVLLNLTNFSFSIEKALAQPLLPQQCPPLSWWQLLTSSWGCPTSGPPHQGKRTAAEDTCRPHPLRLPWLEVAQTWGLTHPSWTRFTLEFTAGNEAAGVPSEQGQWWAKPPTAVPQGMGAPVVPPGHIFIVLGLL